MPTDRAASQFPTPGKRAVTGSNLGRNRLAAVRRADMEERCAPLEQANSRYQRALKRLIVKSDLKRARTIVADLTRDFRQTSFGLGGDAGQWEIQRRRARARLGRFLARSVAQYRDVRALQRSHLRELRTLLNKWHADVPPVGGIALPEDPPGATVFTAPFPLADVHFVKGGDEHIDVTDRSFVLPQTGQLILDADFDDDEHTSFSDGLWDLLYVNAADVIATCGVPYTMPRPGRLRVTAHLRNFYNHASMSLKDNWGFSAGTLRCEYFLLASVLRPSRQFRQFTLIFDKDLTSDGDDVSAVMPDIDQSAPLFIDMTTDESFEQGEPVWVMAGAVLSVVSRLDDMHSHVRALQWWQVNRITVSVVEPLIT